MEDIDNYESLPNSSVATNMVAGAFAGITEHALMFPFDAIKTRMQLVSSQPSAVYSGVLNAMSRIASSEGSTVLWRGVNSVLVGSGPAHALSFATYEFCRDSFRIQGEEGHQIVADGLHFFSEILSLGSLLMIHLGFFWIAMAGACATIAHDGFMTPFDVVKQRMQIQGSTYTGLLHCTLTTFRSEGLKAFYISYPTTILMSIPFQSIHFATYEAVKKYMNPTDSYDPKTHVAAGGLAGALASLFTQPLDVAKTLLQTRGLSSDQLVRQVSGLQEAFTVIFKRYGWAGLLRGLRPRMLTHIPATAISWTTVRFLLEAIFYME